MRGLLALVVLVVATFLGLDMVVVMARSLVVIGLAQFGPVLNRLSLRRRNTPIAFEG